MEQSLNDDEIINILNELNYQKNHTENKNTIYDFAKNYRIIEFTIGAFLGLSITYITRDISFNILNPIISTSFFYGNDKINLFGIEFNVEKILAGIIFAFLSLIILYFMIRYVFGNISERIIMENKNAELVTKMYQYESLFLQRQNSKYMNQILALLQKEKIL